MQNLLPPLSLKGFAVHKLRITPEDQAELVAELGAIAEAAPYFAPLTPWGKPMSVRMTSAGKYGWFTDRKGYRYIDRHPSGVPWPPIPQVVLALWREMVSVDREPDCCLINHYRDKSRMGLHRDADEADFSWPVLSISLGDPALFRVGGTVRTDPTASIELESGDVVVMGGGVRCAYHGIDRIKFGQSALLPQGGRINLTLRVVG